MRYKEIVICAAVRCTDESVVRGHRHHDAIRAARMMGKSACTHPGDQGFITSRNRYVSRKEAFRVQKAAGIKSAAKGGYRGEELFSEDLY